MLVAVGERARSHSIARAVFPIAVIVKRGPADRLVSRRSTVLPGAEGGVADLVGGATQARRGP